MNDNPMMWPCGIMEWQKNGDIHRDEAEGPAYISPEGWMFWYWEGLIHRVHGPAVIGPDGSRKYYDAARLHRINGPAVIRADGTREYWIYGVFQRVAPPLGEEEDR